MSLEEVLERNWRNLRNKPNVLNVGVSTKVVGGVDTGKPCITVYVAEKMLAEKLVLGAMVPQTVEDTVTDVVEIDADYTVGDTGASRLPPHVQRRIAGGVQPE